MLTLTRLQAAAEKAAADKAAADAKVPIFTPILTHPHLLLHAYSLTRLLLHPCSLGSLLLHAYSNTPTLTRLL